MDGSVCKRLFMLVTGLMYRTVIPTGNVNILMLSSDMSHALSIPTCQRIQSVSYLYAHFSMCDYYYVVIITSMVPFTFAGVVFSYNHSKWQLRANLFTESENFLTFCEGRTFLFVFCQQIQNKCDGPNTIHARICVINAQHL